MGHETSAVSPDEPLRGSEDRLVNQALRRSSTFNPRLAAPLTPVCAWRDEKWLRWVRKFDLTIDVLKKATSCRFLNGSTADGGMLMLAKYPSASNVRTAGICSVIMRGAPAAVDACKFGDTKLIVVIERDRELAATACQVVSDTDANLKAHSS